MDLNDYMQRSNTRARRGRILGRLMIVLAVWIIALGYLAAPNFIDASNAGAGPIPIIVGVAGVAVGLIWMIRILRADPEPDAAAWRYRDP